ncbi:hypothetical protein Glove_132g154 [Diversispora epigaea]|uniref:RanBD1 domain-containing protein n=1 Tax=Diversispora epigaea TaxID=1348612 RepID=A0A397J272_9GLOM|nr:hypothetical protein Glove_132g154 [Diversispora epigaea]
MWPQPQGVFGFGTKYARSSFMGGFANMALSSQKSNMSIFDEQISQNNDEEKVNTNNVEEEVPFKTGTQTLLQESEVLTGEENEITEHSVRAKLYFLDEQTWKERGVGILKINYPRNYETSPRLVMRTENVLRVILNVALFRGMHVERSQEKFLSNSNAADTLYEAIRDGCVGILKINYPRNYETSPRLVMRTENVLRVILNVALFRGMHVERSQEKFLSNSNAADTLYEAIRDGCNNFSSK